MKKIYEKPSTLVVEVQQTQVIMSSQATGVSSLRSDYGLANTDEWE